MTGSNPLSAATALLTRFPRQETFKRFILGHLCQLVLLWTVLAPVTGQAGQILNENIALNCLQTETILLACSYRLLQPSATVDIAARSGTQKLEITTHKPYPDTDSVTAVLFLVDTSDPGRQDVISKNAIQLGQIMRRLAPHHQVGLASFDKELVINVPVGGTAGAIETAARSLTAVGLTTELYRNTLKAIEILARTNADRKVIFLLSDGQAEDKAYFHEDVIRAALRHGVIINSLGFPRTIPLSVALQTLRRLSEESGGIYIETDLSFELPAGFMQAPFDNIDRGGIFIVDLDPLQSARPDPPEITLSFKSGPDVIAVAVPVALKAPAVTVLAAPPIQTTVAAITPAVAQTALAPVSPPTGLMDTLLWYGVPIALVILSLLILVILGLLYRRPPLVAPPVNTLVHELKKPLAYLVFQNESAKRFPISSATCRIGRSRDNEMTINDNSVSRRHAEIRRTFDGQFVLYDRESTNGVFVNDHKISNHKLREGDIIEIGDVFLRFTQKPVDFHFSESTAMVKTRAP